MIGFLQGKVIERGANWIIIMTGGVGYKVFVPVELVAEKGARIELYIHHHIREESSDLFGFSTLDELALFEQLITVSGVGPRVALAILSSASDDQVREAIVGGDSALFKAIAGIGPKMAAKIIVELQSKIGGRIGKLALDSKSAEVVEALTGLGYREREISPWLGKLPKKLTTPSEKVRWILQQLSKGR